MDFRSFLLHPVRFPCPLPSSNWNKVHTLTKSAESTVPKWLCHTLLHRRPLSACVCPFNSIHFFVSPLFSSLLIFYFIFFFFWFASFPLFLIIGPCHMVSRFWPFSFLVRLPPVFYCSKNIIITTSINNIGDRAPQSSSSFKSYSVSFRSRNNSNLFLILLFCLSLMSHSISSIKFVWKRNAEPREREHAWDYFWW